MLGAFVGMVAVAAPKALAADFKEALARCAGVTVCKVLPSTHRAATTMHDDYRNTKGCVLMPGICRRPCAPT